MAVFTSGQVRINYEERGEGPALLLLAPGGLSASRAETWRVAPWNPLEVLSSRYRLVAMDQRNTGTSWAPVGDSYGWDSYTDDQLALMDHLGIERFGVLGMCIGGAFIAKLMSRAPEWLACAVALQPIGRDGNEQLFSEFFDAWRTDIQDDHPEAAEDDWTVIKDAMFAADAPTLWSVPDAALAGFATPLLVLQGGDQYHPASASKVMAAGVPGAQLIETWKEGDSVRAGQQAVAEFLREHLG